MRRSLSLKWLPPVRIKIPGDTVVRCLPLLPRGNIPRGKNKKSWWSTHTQSGDPRWIRSMSNSSSGPGVGNRKRQGRKAAGGFWFAPALIPPVWMAPRKGKGPPAESTRQFRSRCHKKAGSINGKVLPGGNAHEKSYRGEQSKYRGGSLLFFAKTCSLGEKSNQNGARPRVGGTYKLVQIERTKFTPRGFPKPFFRVRPRKIAHIFWKAVPKTRLLSVENLALAKLYFGLCF